MRRCNRDYTANQRTQSMAFSDYSVKRGACWTDNWWNDEKQECEVGTERECATSASLNHDYGYFTCSHSVLGKDRHLLRCNLRCVLWGRILQTSAKQEEGAVHLELFQFLAAADGGRNTWLLVARGKDFVSHHVVFVKPHSVYTVDIPAG